MKLKNYLIDKISSLIIISMSYLIVIAMLFVFDVPKSLIIAITIVFVFMILLLFILDYFKKSKFYNALIENVDILDKKYLVLEMMQKPTFYEGEILYQTIYEINKSMIENVKELLDNTSDFKEYIEMWIHEVKIPISSLILLCHNHKDVLDATYLKQVKKLDNYIDQVLYYIRSNYTENDFVIKKVLLDKVISNVALKNKDDLLENKIDLNVDLKNIYVYTDAKWMEFILNQIINNSIKYKRDDVRSYIKISSTKDNIVLSITDNGIGILKKDIGQVFKKTFTGENGRLKTKSTGMGLYIADKLCSKLGHIIEIESEYGKKTTVKITFGINEFYNLNK